MTTKEIGHCWLSSTAEKVHAFNIYRGSTPADSTYCGRKFDPNKVTLWGAAPISCKHCIKVLERGKWPW